MLAIRLIHLHEDSERAVGLCQDASTYKQNKQQQQDHEQEQEQQMQQQHMQKCQSKSSQVNHLFFESESEYEFDPQFELGQCIKKLLLD